jgi:hypothetical protein
MIVPIKAYVFHLTKLFVPNKKCAPLLFTLNGITPFASRQFPICQTQKAKKHDQEKKKWGDGNGT